MEQSLKEKLWAYIIENNPELMFNLQEDYSVQQYLDRKIEALRPRLRQWKKDSLPPYIIEEQAMLELTADLRPSRFHYIRDILEKEFLPDFLRFREAGVLTHEVVNLIGTCKEIFEAIGFSEENRKSRRLRYAVIRTISEYLEQHKKE
ncbi:hypothetical protein [Sinomicrobium weinanense]|uniref:Uncharacterized protein n=1 Tax=Sinomicrobium weinanense TaxID=2842200 RepID=A0A926Q4Z0_9FLAO|nr:hypothetical protein [Sinomicrobium weinanense]MBC9797591.1 hypothetical protein [Sinomicrobium weinanense]MBU3123658.1 hypothetical protein [Sinomicrobium weinanense]